MVLVVLLLVLLQLILARHWFITTMFKNQKLTLFMTILRSIRELVISKKLKILKLLERNSKLSPNKKIMTYIIFNNNISNNSTFSLPKMLNSYLLFLPNPFKIHKLQLSNKKWCWDHTKTPKLANNITILS